MTTYPDPRPVTARPWRWHDDAGGVTLCVLVGNKKTAIVIGSRDLRTIADALHDRADEIEALDRRDDTL